MPVASNARCLGLSVQKTAESAVAVLTRGSMSLLCRSSLGFLAGGVFPQCKLCRRLARSHRCCSWTRLRRPLLYNDRCLGYDSTENCGISAVAVLSRWSMSLFVQFIDGMDVAVIMQRCWVSCWRCLNSVHRQSSWTFQYAQRRGFQRGFGCDEGWAFFRAPPGRPGVERQFSEPSMTKSSLLSRAPAI